MTKEITSKDAFALDFHTLFPAMEDESSVLIGCRKVDYSASKIARAVEDCDAQVLNINVTSLSPSPYTTDELIVSLRFGHLNSESVCRSLERYGYNVINVASSKEYADDTLRMRANELLRYLEI